MCVFHRLMAKVQNPRGLSMASRLSVPHPGRRSQDGRKVLAHLSMFSDVFGVLRTSVCPWVLDYTMAGPLRHQWRFRWERGVGILYHFVTLEVLHSNCDICDICLRERLAVSTRSMPPICRPMSVWPQSWRHRAPSIRVIVVMWNIMKHDVLLIVLLWPGCYFAVQSLDAPVP